MPLVALAEHAAQAKDSISITLNAANEVAVESFLNELIRFTDIPIVIEAALNRTAARETPTIEDILDCDAVARVYANEHINRGISIQR